MQTQLLLLERASQFTLFSIACFCSIKQYILLILVHKNSMNNPTVLASKHYITLALTYQDENCIFKTLPQIRHDIDNENFTNELYLPQLASSLFDNAIKMLCALCRVYLFADQSLIVHFLFTSVYTVVPLNSRDS